MKSVRYIVFSKYNEHTLYIVDQVLNEELDYYYYYYYLLHLAVTWDRLYVWTGLRGLSSDDYLETTAADDC